MYVPKMIVYWLHTCTCKGYNIFDFLCGVKTVLNIIGIAEVDTVVVL